MSHISDPTPKKIAEVFSKTWKKAKVWRLAKSMWNRALTECIQHVLTDGRRLDQLKLNLLGSPLKDCPSTLMSFCKFSNYTEWWWCVKVKTVHSMMSRNVPKVAHSVFQQNWVEHSFATFGGSCSYSWWDTPRIHDGLCNWRQTNLPANWWDPGG